MVRTQLFSRPFVFSAVLSFLCAGSVPGKETPDIVLMMADDLGFSDIGCYGSEISTPQLDSLANNGILFNNFSNTSRCCPSRASLLTGRYSHQAGIGDMNTADEGPGYRGQLLSDVPTLPEMLKQSGYTTAMVGKWHLTRSGTINDGPNGSWPFQRGFDRFFGSMEGAKNYFRPTWFFDQDQEVDAFDDGFYYTNAISKRAADWIRTQPNGKPLFVYTAFYAPHFPLQAPAEAIDRNRGRYLPGWDELRRRRLAKQKTLGIIPNDLVLTSRPEDVPAWESLSAERRTRLDNRMATYAAQVEMLDQGVGRILDALRETGRLENTIILFLSDNGGASKGGAFGAGPDIKVGRPDAPIATTYGKGWATLSNTPFRMHKANTHEGGVMAPLILHWPRGLGVHPVIRRDVAHIVDIAPTLVGAVAPKVKYPFSGIDLLKHTREGGEPVYYEHEKSRAVRAGSWKLVNEGKSTKWELYDLSRDRAEQRNLAAECPDKLDDLRRLWEAWAKQNHAKTK